MYRWFANRFLKKTAFALRLLLIPLLLNGCTGHIVDGSTSQTESDTSENKIIDEHVAQCDMLWSLDDKKTLENPSFWLQAMDCAEPLRSIQARSLANNLSNISWSTAFKQGILIANADPALDERRKIVEQLQDYSPLIPNTVRQLVQLWHKRQMLQIALAEARIRYQRLQNESDNQIDRLRENLAQLKYNLQNTKNKLENLTDIERQLSSRKQLQNTLRVETKPSTQTTPTTDPTTLPVLNKEHQSDDSM